MNGYQSRENLGIISKNGQSSSAKARAPIKQQKKPSHKRGPARKLAMGLLIQVQAVFLHGFGQGHGLMKAQAQSFAGNRIDAS